MGKLNLPQIHGSAEVGPKASIGEGTSIWQHCVIQDGAVLGSRCKVGANVFIEKGARIGNHTTIKNNIAIFSGVVCEDDVFLGPNCVFTNVVNPRSFISRKDKFQKTRIKRGATIGANATIICGNTVGNYAMVGAGAVVTRNVGDYELVAGNPAKKIGYVCECGCRLPENMKCRECGKGYKLMNDKLVKANGAGGNSNRMKPRQCTCCIMDDSGDQTITFDKNGMCNYCTEALSVKNKVYLPNSKGQKLLHRIVRQMKADGAGKKYDCIMGLSGGLDSSYLAYIAWKCGLRVLAVHLDDGYDTDISKKNLEKLVKCTGFDYKVISPDPYQYNQLELAFMKAGVPNLAVPQDDIVWGFLYDLMRKYKIKYFLSGENFSTESILQRGNTHRYTDVVHIRAINKEFGLSPIDKLKFVSTARRAFEKRTQKIVTARLLNYVEYTREKAFKELDGFCGFQYYGRKHLENKFTAFLQLKWLPEKFNVDKRRSHLSSLIVSGQMARDEALEEMKEPLYDQAQMDGYIEEIEGNMGVSHDEFMELMKKEPHSHDDYKTEDDTFFFKVLTGLSKVRKKVLKKK